MADPEAVDELAVLLARMLDARQRDDLGNAVYAGHLSFSKHRQNGLPVYDSAGCALVLAALTRVKHTSGPAESERGYGGTGSPAGDSVREMVLLSRVHMMAPSGRRLPAPATLKRWCRRGRVSAGKDERGRWWVALSDVTREIAQRKD